MIVAAEGEGEYLSAGSVRKVVVHGTIGEMVNHICEKHTQSAFLCLSCDRVLSINAKKVPP